MAAVDLSGGATIGVERNTNAFDLSNTEIPRTTAGGSSARDDTTTRLTATAAAGNKGEGPIHMQLRGQYSQVKSSSADSLDHNEYTLGANLDWKPGQVYDLSVQASQSRLPLSLADIGGTEARLQTTTQAQATLRVRPTPYLQIGLAPGWSEVKTPLPGAQNFTLRQNTGTASLDFLGAGQFVPGVTASESKGVNSGIANATRYEERSFQGTLNYRATGFSTFAFAAGHTRRTTRPVLRANGPAGPADEQTNSALTGSLAYQRQLSVKTSIDVRAFRDFQQYDAGVNTSVGTGFDIGVTWTATSKLSASANTRYGWSTIEDLQIGGTVGQRKDLLRNYSFSVGYLATNRLSIRTYVSRRIRNSNGTFADQFNGTSTGIDLTARID